MRSSAVLACSVVFVVFALGQSQTYVPPSGYVPDSVTAVQIAEAVLVPVYGRKQIESQRPFTARLKKDVWTVSGTLRCRDQAGKISSICSGGTAVVQISKQDAHIISMIHHK